MSPYPFTHGIPRGGRDASTSPQQVAGASAVAGPGQPGGPRAADAAAGDGTAATGSGEVQGGPAAPWNPLETRGRSWLWEKIWANYNIL